MQGDSFLSSLKGTPNPDPDQVAYHRYWMHADDIHNAYVRTVTVSNTVELLTSIDIQAHYGIRSKRYKLIFWYNEGYGLPGANPGGEEQEWELFDCEQDPMELFNLWNSTGQDIAGVREKMVRLLEDKMEEIGDTPAHPIRLPAEELRAMYVPGANIAAKAQAHNM
jgi:hypothetical protein